MHTLRSLDPRVKLVCLVVYVIVALHARTLPSLGLCLAAACALAFATHMRLSDAERVLRPIAIILVVTVVMQVLYLQQGQVLVQLGPVAVTQEALAAAAAMLVGLLSIMVASVAFMRCSDTQGLTRSLRWVLGPLRAVGVRVDAFMFSLAVAFRFVPVLAGEFQQVRRAQMARCGTFDGGVRQRVGSYMRLFAPLVRSSFRRADALAEASVARCFSCGIEPSSLHVDRFGAHEVAALVFAVVFAIVGFAL